ncbi:MAG: protein translocase subunit SecD, partial [Verrucomicrobiota bacterium]
MMQYWILFGGIAFLMTFIAHLVAEQGKSRRYLGSLCAIICVLVCIASLTPLSKTIKLGLDLKGGTAFLIELEGNPSSKALEQAVEVIRKRVDRFGLSEPMIQPTGANRISVQIPGLTEQDKEAARQQLSQVAKLEFRVVHPQNDSLIQQALLDRNQVPAGFEILNMKYKLDDGSEHSQPLLVKRIPEMTGKHVARARTGFSQLGEPNVGIDFTSQGSKIFGEVTQANLKNRLAIVLDGEVKSAPVIQEVMFSSASISGGRMTTKQAEDLASVLENPLETPVRIVEERGVDPSLGLDSIQSGKSALAFATLGVTVFMVAYYRLAGIYAIIALFVNLLILFGLLAQFHFTLTLPGIAGVILTIGMAVDANVLIYERIRDEIGRGKPLRAAIDSGFDRAFSAIFDSNITTIIPAVILIFMGSGPLQGFSVTLTLGIVANLFSAIVVTRNLFEWTLLLPSFRKLTMMEFVKNPNIDFLKLRWIAVGLSVFILVVGGAAFHQKGDQAYGVDFIGGDSLTLSFQNSVEVSKLRETLEKKGLNIHLIQYAKGENKLSVQVHEKQGDQVISTLQSSFPQAGFQKVGLDRVGSQIGQELQHRAAFSLLLGLLGILVYASFRFEWSYAVAATVSQVHDVLIAVCLAVALGSELSLTLVGAFLTIAGYSINEKIVVFDRVREIVKSGTKQSLGEILNASLNVTLARTVITGGTTLIAITFLIFFGGLVIHGF